MFSQYFQHYLRVKTNSQELKCVQIFLQGKAETKQRRIYRAGGFRVASPFFFLGGCLLAMFSHNRRGEFWSPQPLRRPLIPSMMAPPSQPNHLPNAPPLKTITLGVRFYYMNIGRTLTYHPLQPPTWKILIYIFF